MYRIELSPGEETAFRSIEELAVAIRRKVVTSRARIYHNATSKWLPIQFHPHYKLALTMPLTQADLVAGPPVAPLSGLKLGERAPATVAPSSAARESETQAALTAWPEPKSVAPPAVKPVARPAPKGPEPSQLPIILGTPSPELRRIVQPFRAPEPRRKAEARFEEQTRTVEPSRAKGSRRRRKPSRSVRVALAGAILIACAHLLVSAASPPASEAAVDRPRTPRRLIEAPAEELKDVTPRTIAAVLPALQSISIPGLNSASNPKPPAPKSAAPKLAPVDSAPGSARIESVAVSDSTAEIQAAPDAGEITGAAEAEFVAPQMIDSSGKQALKRILRSIGGSPAAETKPPKR